jgi:hypothetical protein|tara:strand:- start:152 stop:328 length:177 start_codon:yes stop_codon:yes gene_type:complete
VTKDVKKKPAIYNFSHEDGIASQMSDKQRKAFVKGLVQLSQKKLREEKARGRKDSTAK